MWRTVYPFFTSVEKAILFSHSSVRCLSRTNGVSACSTSTSTSQVVCKICRRHTHVGAKASSSLSRSITLHQPIFIFSPHSQTQSLYRKHKQPLVILHRLFASQQEGGGNHKRTGSSSNRANQTTATYMTALAIAVVGLSYAAVPLYRIFCQASGYGGTVGVVDPSEKVENMEPLRERELTIRLVHGNYFTAVCEYCLLEEQNNTMHSINQLYHRSYKYIVMYVALSPGLPAAMSLHTRKVGEPWR